MRQSTPNESTSKMLELASSLDVDINLLDPSLCKSSNAFQDLELASSLNFDGQILELPLASTNSALRTLNLPPSEFMEMASNMRLEDLFSLEAH
jgi:hypothetical protein